MKKILIVEDEVALREAFVMVLELQGYEVVQAENGHEALELLKTFNPDIIILDILMPIMGGIEFLETAELKMTHPNTHVIVLSNLSDDRTIRKVQDLQVDDYVLKSSVSPITLVDKVENILTSK